MGLKFYAVAWHAAKIEDDHIKGKLGVTVVLAVGRDEAGMEAEAEVTKDSPRDDGWGLYHLHVQEIPLDTLHRALEEMSKGESHGEA
jgi:hypothetical protein